MASWFGLLARSRPLSFPVTIGETLPKGNVIVFVEHASALHLCLAVDINGPTVAVRTNPSDPYGKVLVIAGSDAAQMLNAARAITLGKALLQGRTAEIDSFELPPPRTADDAPLWMRTDRPVPNFGLCGRSRVAE